MNDSPGKFLRCLIIFLNLRKRPVFPAIVHERLWARDSSNGFRIKPELWKRNTAAKFGVALAARARMKERYHAAGSLSGLPLVLPFATGSSRCRHRGACGWDHRRL